MIFARLARLGSWAVNERRTNVLEEHNWLAAPHHLIPIHSKLFSVSDPAIEVDLPFPGADPKNDRTGLAIADSTVARPRKTCINIPHSCSIARISAKKYHHIPPIRAKANTHWTSIMRAVSEDESVASSYQAFGFESQSAATRGSSAMSSWSRTWLPFHCVVAGVRRPILAVATYAMIMNGLRNKYLLFVGAKAERVWGCRINRWWQMTLAGL